MRLESPGGRGTATPARWLLPLVPAGIAFALLLAACGGTSKAGAKPDRAKDAQQAALEFARCMRDHGVDMPDPQVGDGGFVRIGPGPGGGSGKPEQPIDQEAEKACRHFLDKAVQESGGAGRMEPKEQERALKFARCMREHGVDMPDPDFSGGGVRIKVGSDGVDPDSPTFRAAHEACKQWFGPAVKESGGGPGPAGRAS